MESIDARIRFARLLLGLAVMSVALSIGHALSRTAGVVRARPAVLALGARLPMSDLALSGGARWLRAPSLEDPFAAFADGPAAHDPDPAGAAIPPPREVFVREAADARRPR